MKRFAHLPEPAPSPLATLRDQTAARPSQVRSSLRVCGLVALWMLAAACQPKTAGTPAQQAATTPIATSAPDPGANPTGAPGTASAPASVTSAPTTAHAPAAISTTTVNYQAGATPLIGYLAMPGTAGRHPGVLVVPEWWGQNTYAQMRARKLAELGYVALAVDMYGEGKTTDDPKQAGAWAQAATTDPSLTKQRFVAARDVLANNASVDSSKIGAIGYCFGGGVVLNMALMGVPLDPVVSFHGGLKSVRPAAEAPFHSQVLLEVGGADPMATPEDGAAVKATFEAAGATVQMDVYPGAKHAFTNPAATEVGLKHNLPVAYDKSADDKSWNNLVQLLQRTWPAP